MWKFKVYYCTFNTPILTVSQVTFKYSNKLFKFIIFKLILVNTLMTIYWFFCSEDWLYLFIYFNYIKYIPIVIWDYKQNISKVNWFIWHFNFCLIFIYFVIYSFFFFFFTLYIYYFKKKKSPLSLFTHAKVTLPKGFIATWLFIPLSHPLDL